MDFGKLFLVIVLFLIVIFTPTLFEYSIKEKEEIEGISNYDELNANTTWEQSYYFKKKDILYNTNDKCDLVCERLGKSPDVCNSDNSQSTCINQINGKKIPTKCTYYNNRCMVA